MSGLLPCHYTSLMRLAPLLAALVLTITAQAQWEMQDAHITADLRGIDYVGNGVAWASGSNGTVLRTEDMGFVWQLCTTPPGAEKLDFRGVQAFDNNTAIVMSSGKGDLSRLYKTTDGCQTWKLLFTNPDSPDGFFDQILFLDHQHGLLFGDPAHGTPEHNPVEGGYFAFRIRVTPDAGSTWIPVSDPEMPQPGHNLMPLGQEGLFAASNSSASIQDGLLWIGTGGARVLKRHLFLPAERRFLFTPAFCAGAIDPESRSCGLPWLDWTNTTAPLASENTASGIFSLRFATAMRGVAVGGDYLKPGDSKGTAAFSQNGGQDWTAATTPPHGYRSAVAYDTKSKTWITVGPNGTDISTDDGRNWRALKPDLKLNDVPDADQHWNALSLPFVVGPHGRIGILREDALTAAASHAK